MKLPRCPTGVSKRGRTLARTLRLLRLLDGTQTMTLGELARALRVCPRTVRRDLAVLEEVGAELWREAMTTDDGGPCVRYTGLHWSDPRQADRENPAHARRKSLDG